jgi:benzoate membrane transport protein
MLSHLERPSSPPSWRKVLSDFGSHYAANGLIGLVFAATAPVAIILSVGTNGGLTEAELSSWIFGAFFVNGLITLLMCWLYRQPLGFYWTIPGTVLVGPSLTHLSFPEVIGAFYLTGALVLLLGITGWIRKVMQMIPMPIVMAMIAGVFLRFGLDLIRSLHNDILIAGPMVAGWLILTARPALARRLPPLIGALLIGAMASVLLGRVSTTAFGGFEFIQPVMHIPKWSWGAMFELVIPLAITVLVVQNGQGIALLKAEDHQPPINTIAVASGIGAILSACVGSVSSCLTGPTNAILMSSGERSRQYSAGIFMGTLSIIFGLMSPGFTRLLLNTPKTFIVVLAGLAMLRVLQSAFIASFNARFSLGALVAFLVTVADLNLMNIGAAFWGLLAGIAVSFILERSDFEITTG